MTDSDKNPRSKTASSRWALVPVGLLITSVIGFSWMAMIAVHDPNFALEPDYYQKALHWDQTQGQAATNQRLAYHFSVPPSITLDAHGRATFSLKLTDSGGRPIRGARVLAQAFPNAFSTEISSLIFQEHEPGSYSVTLSAKRAGVWELRLAVENGADRATAIERCELRPGAA
ncbi:MAG: FixH family protein [Pseudomonadota bacterium]